jgi:TPR repeat protein
VPRDRQRAYHYLDRAAQAGNVEAQYNLGVMHAYGHGVERNRDRSLELFRQAADRGYVAAQNGLAVTLTDGSIDNNFTEAFIYFERCVCVCVCACVCVVYVCVDVCMELCGCLEEWDSRYAYLQK